ncbi:tetratricopeptide repeat protein [Roseicyclus marinus]|uniref:tetratricopeptide repeat protein n=1 Tax=Roseicyclus marinus TaxID=2161673 RepID=UPI0036168D7F
MPDPVTRAFLPPVLFAALLLSVAPMATAQQATPAAPADNAETEAVRLAAETEAARLAAEADAAAEAAAAAQAAAIAEAAAEAEARRAAVAAEIARLAAEREARRQADAGIAACLDTAGPPSAAVPVDEAAQRALFTRLRDALPACQEAANLDPQAGGPLFHLATVAQARGEHREAVALYDRAAAAGVGAAHTRLGDYYNFGIGPIRPDIDRAVASYRAATDLGDLAGTTTLAFMYRLGRGVPRDTAEMLRLFRIAADGGYHFAQINLAQTYLTGEGVPGGADPALGIPDARAAVPLLAAAARGGNLDAARGLAALYATGAEGVPPNASQRLRWTRHVAETGDPAAIAALAFLREQGIGAPADPLAAAQGYIAALETGQIAPEALRAAGGPRAPGWDRQTAIEFQRILQERGLYRGPLDGLVGPGTLGAARAVSD